MNKWQKQQYAKATARAAVEMNQPVHDPICRLCQIPGPMSGIVDLDIGTPRYTCGKCGFSGDMLHLLCRERNIPLRDELTRLLAKEVRGEQVDELVREDTLSSTLWSWWKAKTADYLTTASVDHWPSGRSEFLRLIDVPETHAALDELQGIILPVDWRESPLATSKERKRRRPIYRVCSLRETSPGRAVGLTAFTNTGGLLTWDDRYLFPVARGSSVIGMTRYARSHLSHQPPTLIDVPSEYFQRVARGGTTNCVATVGTAHHTAKRWPGSIQRLMNDDRSEDLGPIRATVGPSRATDTPLFVTSTGRYRQIVNGMLYDEAGRMLYPKVCRVLEVVNCADRKHLRVGWGGNEEYWIEEKQLEDVIRVRLPADLKHLNRDLRIGAYMFGGFDTYSCPYELGWDGKGYGVPQGLIVGGKLYHQPWRCGDFAASEIVFSSSQVRKALHHGHGLLDKFKSVAASWLASTSAPITPDSGPYRMVRTNEIVRGLLGAYLIWFTARPPDRKPAVQSIDEWVTAWGEMTV